MIVLDASILIAHLDTTDVHHRRASAMLLSAATDDEELAASPITLAEVLVGPARAGLLEQALAALRLLGVINVDLPTDAPARLATLRAATRLRLPDCCVLLSATQTGAAIATFDAALASAATSSGVPVHAP